MYEEMMHTLYRFNTLLITRGHVISKRNTIRCVINIVVMRVHWFELLMLQFSDRVSEKEVQCWLFRWNDPDRYYSEFCLEISTFFYWYWTIHFKMWKKFHLDKPTKYNSWNGGPYDGSSCKRLYMHQKIE